jgi:hypothetical protein
VVLILVNDFSCYLRLSLCNISHGLTEPQKTMKNYHSTIYLIILDRKNIVNSVAVMKLQLLLMQALYVLIKKNHSGEYQNELLHSNN